jgi:hypothetical protein
MKYYLSALTLLVLLVAACEKVETPKSKEDELRDGKWVLAKSFEKTYKKYPTDTILTTDSIKLETLPDCKKDDFLQFRDGVNGALNTGAKKCPQGETSEIPITWGFLDNYTRMYIYDAGDMFLDNDDINADVVELTGSNITIRYRVINNTSNIPNKDTVTFKAYLKRM